MLFQRRSSEIPERTAAKPGVGRTVRRAPQLSLALVGLVALAATSACSDESAPEMLRASESPCGTLDPSLAKGPASELFAPKSIPAFDFYLPEDSWASLQAHAVDEEYVPARACYNGRALGVVGLRFKGAYGSLIDCFDAAGQNTCRKLGMKVKFDEYEREHRFLGLKRLNFQGNRYDDSYLKEKLSLELYNEMGVVAPRASWALLRVNGEEQGLFGMVEQLDARFTADRWPQDGDGNLYKEVWPGEADPARIASHLETNQDEADTSRFQAFSAAIRAAGGTTRPVFDEYMDVEQFARYMAVDDAIANFDGITTFYTGADVQGASNHNFYLYQKADGRFTVIPWDLESTLVLGYFGVVPPWQETPDDCSLTYSVWNGGGRVMAPGCDAIFEGLAADRSAYQEAAQELLDGPFALERMNEKLERYAAFIRAAASADPHGPGATKFEQGVGFLKQQFPALRRRLERLLSGEPTAPTLLELEQVQDFETADDYSILAGSALFSNPASTVSVELNGSDAIGGAQSLRMLFDFQNEPAPWGQWMLYAIPLTNSSGDLTGLQGVRFKARSNVARAFRVELDSPGNSHADEGIKMGWDLRLTSETTEFSVSLVDAKIPAWASDPGDSLDNILKEVTALSFKPECANRDSAGQLPAGTSDSGWVDLDDIEFF